MGHRIRGGFTLIELMAVMLILAIVAALARPDFGVLMAGARARAAIRGMVTDIRYAQQMAVSERKTYYIYFSSSNDFYRVKVSSDSQPRVVKQVMLAGSIDILGTSFYGDEMHFTSSGAPSAGGTINLQDYRGKDYSITILPATGRVRVYY